MNFELSKELSEAINGLDSISDIDSKTMQRAKGILINTRSAINNDKEDDKKKYKKQFRDYVINAGEKADRIIGFLANFATIAAFFGLSI